MGRTLEVLKRSKASPMTLKVAPQPPTHSPPTILPLSNNSDEIPFIEVGGPRHALLGAAVMMSQRDRGPRLEEQGAKTEAPKNDAGSIADPQSATIDFSSTLNLHSLSVAFHPLGSLHSIETATGLIASDLAVYHQPDSLASQEFRSVAMGIQQQLAAGGTHILFLAAVSPRAGTTTTVLNLAMSWAKHEKRNV